MKRLLVVADDLGLTPGVNRGIARAFQDGIVTSASFLPNTRHFEETAEMVRSLSGLKVGVHLSLVGGAPVSPVTAVPSLAPRRRMFRRSWKEFLPAWLAGRVREEEVREEWRAQITRVREAGFSPSHLDSHQHLHVLLGLWRIAVGLAREFSIRRIRLPKESGPAAPRTPFSRLAVRAALATAAGRLSIPESPATCDHLFGIGETGHLDLGALGHLLERIPDGWSELITHPGIPDAELTAEYRWGYEWEEESRALCAPEIRRRIADLGIVLDRE